MIAGGDVTSTHTISSTRQIIDTVNYTFNYEQHAGEDTISTSIYLLLPKDENPNDLPWLSDYMKRKRLRPWCISYEVAPKPSGQSPFHHGP